MEVSLSDWQSFIKQHPTAHILQTGEWGELKSSFGWQPLRIIAGESGAQLLLRRLPLDRTVAYLPKGPVSVPQDDRVNNRLWEEVKRITRQKRAIFLKVETDSWDEEQVRSTLPGSFRISAHSIQPRRTIVVDLSAGEEIVLSRMKQKTRYNIRLAQKNGVVVRAWNDLAAFHRMLQVTGGRDQFGVHLPLYYQKAYDLFHPQGMCELLLAEHETNALAAIMVFARGERAWYFYGASASEDRNRMPTYLLQWEAMRWAMARGCREYDLWGVPDHEEEELEAHFTEYSGGLWGVYRFKRGFGGDLKRSAPAMDEVYHPLLYQAYVRFIASRERV